MSETINKAETLLARQRAFFRAGRTMSVDFRITMLKRLYKELKENNKALTDALTKDLKKRLGVK